MAYSKYINMENIQELENLFNFIKKSKMQLSYWELKNWFNQIDYTIIGSGIVGLHTALRLREKYPASKN